MKLDHTNHFQIFLRSSSQQNSADLQYRSQNNSKNSAFSNVSLGALSMVAAAKLKDEKEKDPSDELDVLELSSANTEENIVLESSSKSCRVCDSGNIRLSPTKLIK